MAKPMTRLRGSRPGQFLTKLLQDEAPNLAALLAWGMLSTLLPLLLGILAVAGLLLRDNGSRLFATWAAHQMQCSGRCPFRCPAGAWPGRPSAGDSRR